MRSRPCRSDARSSLWFTSQQLVVWDAFRFAKDPLANKPTAVPGSLIPVPKHDPDRLLRSGNNMDCPCNLFIPISSYFHPQPITTVLYAQICLRIRSTTELRNFLHCLLPGEHQEYAPQDSATVGNSGQIKRFAGEKKRHKMPSNLPWQKDKGFKRVWAFQTLQFEALRAQNLSRSP